MAHTDSLHPPRRCWRSAAFWHVHCRVVLASLALRDKALTSQPRRPLTVSPHRATYSKREKRVLDQIVEHVLIPGISSSYLPSFYNSLSTCIKRAILAGHAPPKLFLDKVTRSKRFYSSAYRVWLVIFSRPKHHFLAALLCHGFRQWQSSLFPFRFLFIFFVLFCRFWVVLLIF